MYLATHAALLFSEARYDEIVTLLEEARGELEADTGSLWLDLAIAEAALARGRPEKAEEALAAYALEQPSAGPIIRAQATGFRAQIAAARGDAERAEEAFKQAAAAFREYGMPFNVARTQLEHAEWLVSVGRETEALPLVTEARETFERLRATPWLERADALAARVPSPAAVSA